MVVTFTAGGTPDANALPVPKTPTLKSAEHFSVIGTKQRNYDIEAVLGGRATFGQGAVRQPAAGQLRGERHAHGGNVLEAESE